MDEEDEENEEDEQEEEEEERQNTRQCSASQLQTCRRPHYYNQLIV